MNRLLEERGKVINGEQIVYLRIRAGNELWNRNNTVDTLNIVQYNFVTTHYGKPIKVIQFSFFKICHIAEHKSVVAIFRVKKNYNKRVAQYKMLDMEWLIIDRDGLIEHFKDKPKPYWYDDKLDYLEDLITECRAYTTAVFSINPPLPLNQTKFIP